MLIFTFFVAWYQLLDCEASVWKLLLNGNEINYSIVMNNASRHKRIALHERIWCMKVQEQESNMIAMMYSFTTILHYRGQIGTKDI